MRSNSLSPFGKIASAVITVGLVISLLPASSLALETGETEQQLCSTASVASLSANANKTDGFEKVEPVLKSRARMSNGTWRKAEYGYPGVTVDLGKADSKQNLAVVKLDALTYDKDAAASGYTAGITYRARQKAGWTTWKDNFAKCGKKKNPVQAVQIKLTGTVAEYYDIYYRCKAEDLGWLGWTSNGSSAGTVGYNKQLKDIQVVLKKKDKSAPGSTKLPFVTYTMCNLSYGATTVGGSTFSAKMGNTAGKAKNSAAALSSVKGTATSSTMSGTLKYSVYQKGSGWSSKVSNGANAGSSSRKTMALKMKLTGKMGKYFDLYYRVYVKGYGWLGWAKGANPAGNTTYDLFITGFQATVVLKGCSAPGSSANSFVHAGGVLSDLGYTKRLQKHANKLSSATDYCIVVDTNTNRVGIFTGYKGNWTMIKYWLCTTGAPGSGTVHGQFTTAEKGLSFGEEKGYSCWYYTQFHGNYLFHSVLYYPGSKTNVMDGTLGANASHGCVRLAIKNAKWIYDNIPTGTRVRVY